MDFTKKLAAFLAAAAQDVGGAAEGTTEGIDGGYLEGSAGAPLA